MINRFDQRQVYEATMHSCLVAVAEGFPHLTIRDIVDPPHEWFDAALARQIAMHLMVYEFGWPKRRVVEIEERSREAINRALRTINDRMRHDKFAAQYLKMTERARSLLFLVTSQNEPDFSEVA